MRKIYIQAIVINILLSFELITTIYIKD